MRNKLIIFTVFLLLTSLLLPNLLGAAEEKAEDKKIVAKTTTMTDAAKKAAWVKKTTKSGKTSADVVWTLIAAFLVFFMQAGFALVETGFTRAKNAVNIIMKNMMDFSMGALAYFLVGFSIMFGADTLGGTFGFSGLGIFNSTGEPLVMTFGKLSAMNMDYLWQFTFWMFQAVFAATAATIVSGAMAERTKFTSYLVYSLFISAVIYPISGHWIWGGGWLAKMGMIDFAGSTVVHSVGGWAALMGAMVLGPRLGKYTAEGKSRAIPGHNIPLASLGVFILFFGWFGFNAGSTTEANFTIGVIAVTTALSAAAGAIMAMFTVWLKHGKPDGSMTLNGVLAGLVAITAGTANVSPVGAIIIGAIAGILVVFSIEFIDKVLKIDDPVGAISVHGVMGAFGTLAVGLFAHPSYGGAAGLFNGGGLNLFWTQLIGVSAVFMWVSVTALILFLVIKATMGLRVTDEEQLKGLDVGEHGMEAYSGFQIYTTE